MNNPSFKIALAALGAALIAWVGVFFFIQSLHERRADAAKAIRESQQANMSETNRNQMLSVITATESGRQQIEEMLTIDLLSLADRVVAAGVDAGVVLRVANPTQEASALQKNKEAKGPTISTVHFTIEAEGPFEKLYHALALLETLPVPVRVEEVSFLQSNDDSASTWHMKVRMRILT